MLQTLKFNNNKQKKSLFYDEKSLVGLTPDFSLKSFSFLFLDVVKESSRDAEAASTFKGQSQQQTF
jgi:hypothetical protein